MAHHVPSRPRQITQRRSFAIVASQYNATYVQGLVEHATRELQVLVPGANISVWEVPGAFEIPFFVQEVAERGSVDAILALGVIIEGATAHAALIGQAITQALMDCGLRYRLPVIHEVLLVSNEAQAEARCLQEEMNRGTEAARTTVRLLQSLTEFKGR